MKKILALVALGLFGLVSYANADSFTVSDVPWHRVNAYNTTFGDWKADTLFAVLNHTSVDTTAVFTLNDCDLASIFQQGKSASDTTTVALFVIYADSSVASTVNFKAATAALQQNFSDNSANWQTVRTYTCYNTDAAKSWTIPIWWATGLTNDYGIDLATTGSQITGKLRFIVSTASGTACAQARCKLVKFQASTGRLEK